MTSRVETLVNTRISVNSVCSQKFEESFASSGTGLLCLLQATLTHILRETITSKNVNVGWQKSKRGISPAEGK